MRPSRYGVVDSNSPPVDLHSGTTLSRLLRVIQMLKIHKGESAAPSGGSVVHDVGAGQRSVTTKDFFQIFLARVVGEVEDAQAGAFGWRLSISLVPFAIGHGRTRSAAPRRRATITVSSTVSSAISTTAIAGPRPGITASAIAGSGPRAPTSSIATAAPVAAPTAALLVIPTAAATAAFGRRTAALAARPALTAALTARRAFATRRRSLPRRPLSRRVGIVVGTSGTRFATRHLC